MEWESLSNKSLSLAMDVLDIIPKASARKPFGFGPSRHIHIYFKKQDQSERGPFEARVLIAFAHWIEFPNSPRLSPDSFKNSDGIKFLKSRGFESRAVVSQIK